MSRKQELYLMILSSGITYSRGVQSIAYRSWWRISPWRWKRICTVGYEMAEFLHNIPPLVANEEFTRHDIWFLNKAERFFTDKSTAKMADHLFPKMKQVFDLVPDEMRSELKWNGPISPARTPAQRKDLNMFLLEIAETNVNIESLRGAIAQGADVNACDNAGRTALRIAKELGKDDFVRELIKAGAKE